MSTLAEWEFVIVALTEAHVPPSVGRCTHQLGLVLAEIGKDLDFWADVPGIPPRRYPKDSLKLVHLRWLQLALQSRLLAERHKTLLHEMAAECLL